MKKCKNCNGNCHCNKTMRDTAVDEASNKNKTTGCVDCTCNELREMLEE